MHYNLHLRVLKISLTFSYTNLSKTFIRRCLDTQKMDDLYSEGTIYYFLQVLGIEDATIGNYNIIKFSLH